MEKAIFLLQPHDHHIAWKTQRGDKAKASGVSVMHGHFQFTFSKVYLYFQLHVQCNRGKKEFTQVGSASEQPRTEHTQIYPDFLYIRHLPVQPELAYNQFFRWICRIAGDNARHKSSVQELFLEYQSKGFVCASHYNFMN